MVAFLDALSQTADDINDHVGNDTFGKLVGTWYSYDANGKVVTKSGSGDGLGLYLHNVPTSDQQRVVMTDDSGALKTYSFTANCGLNDR